MLYVKITYIVAQGISSDAVTMRKLRLGVVLVVVYCGVVCGASDTVTGSFSSKEKEPSCSTQECISKGEPTVCTGLV